jgi:hypothetical protein
MLFLNFCEARKKFIRVKKTSYKFLQGYSQEMAEEIEQHFFKI